ncbi:MAG: Gfo/Idh/MocA family oxidoreductase [Bacteroidota bacterium]
MADKIVRIGILGCANIARKSVIPAILSLSGKYKLKYIASRTAEKAESFAKEFECSPIVGYEELIYSDDVDALYIPLPTGMHKEWINKALQAGKHVYSEKSIAYSYHEAQEMVNNARGKGLGLMEGYMFLYHSQHSEVFKLINSGSIGEIRHFYSSFGFPPLQPDNFRYSENMGGGALLDAAGYTLRATHFIMGSELEVKAATLHMDASKGTNIYGSAFLSNSKGIGATIAFGFDNFYQCRYEVWGELGKITVERAFTAPPNMSPKIVFENTAGLHVINAQPDNHFIRSFEEFYKLITKTELMEKHYSDILSQSQSLELIREYSN